MKKVTILKDDARELLGFLEKHYDFLEHLESTLEVVSFGNSLDEMNELSLRVNDALEESYESNLPNNEETLESLLAILDHYVELLGKGKNNARKISKAKKLIVDLTEMSDGVEDAKNIHSFCATNGTEFEWIEPITKFGVDVSDYDTDKADYSADLIEFMNYYKVDHGDTNFKKIEFR